MSGAPSAFLSRPLILHVSGSPAAGFRLTFLTSGLVFLATMPLVFLMPTGKQAGARP